MSKNGKWVLLKVHRGLKNGLKPPFFGILIERWERDAPKSVINIRKYDIENRLVIQPYGKIVHFEFISDCLLTIHNGNVIILSKLV